MVKYLYHYSENPRKQLMTVRAQGVEVGAYEKYDEWNKVTHAAGSYVDHISVFFMRIPLTTIHTHYPKDHKSWFKGNVMHEHLVLLEKLPDMPYQFTETLMHKRLLATFPVHDYTEEQLIAFKRRLYAAQRKAGEIGITHKGLVKKLNELEHTVYAAYAQLKNIPAWDDNEYKYAAHIPHLLLYPPLGIIKPSIVRKITIGKANSYKDW